MSGEAQIARTAQEIFPEGEPLNEAEAADRFAAAASGLLALANETLAAVKQAREETQGALDKLEASLALSHVRGETRIALDNLEAHLASSHLSGERLTATPLHEVSRAPVGKPARLARTKGTRRSSGRRDSKRDQLLKIIKEGHGLTRGEILEKMGQKGNKSGEMSVSNALTGLTKGNKVRRAAAARK